MIELCFCYPPQSTLIVVVDTGDWLETFGNVLTCFNWQVTPFLAFSQVNDG